MTSLAYALGELIDAGHDDDAERVLRFFARDVHVALTSAGKIHPLAVLAEALEQGGYGSPLVWRDTNGAPGIVLRTWRVRNVEAVDAEPVTFEGTDLIARPDITHRLRALLGVDLQELTVVDRADLRDMDE